MANDDEDSCIQRFRDLRSLLEDADATWSHLEERLDQVQREALALHSEELEKYFGFQQSDMFNEAEGGFFLKVRDRVQRVLLGPLADEMRQQVIPQGSIIESSEALIPSLVLDDLLDSWELKVEPLMEQATELDERLARRARRKAKRDPTGLRSAMQVESKDRPAAWVPAAKALEEIAEPTRRLSDFLRQQVSQNIVERLALAVPAVIARAVCDWHFRGLLTEFHQLESWWEGARAALESREELWQRLVEEEGLFLRRIDRGVEALRASRQLYVAYADFGSSLSTSSSGWPSHLMPLLSETAKEMTSRLRPVRDSAAWRVVDAAKKIQKELHESKKQAEHQNSWNSLSSKEALQTFLSALQASSNTSTSSQSNADAKEQSAMILVKRVDSLTAVMGSLRDTFRAEVTSDSVKSITSVLDELLQATVNLSEDLLCLLDDPSDEEVFADCVSKWRALGQDCNAAVRIEESQSALPVKPSVDMQRCIMILRGLYVFLTDADLRLGLFSSTQDEWELVAGRGDKLPVGSSNAISVTIPPSPSPSSSPQRQSFGSPRGGYAPRRLRFEEVQQTVDVVAVAGDEVKSPIIIPGLPLEALDSTRRPADIAPPSISQPGTSGSCRPGTPSWLRPPWQRPDTPSAASWTRPDTPSTVCDDAEVAPVARFKFIDGQFIPMKQSSLSGKQLPPLQLGYQASPGRLPRRVQ